MIVVNFLGALILSILIHELGHYFAALIYGVRAKEVSVCTGPQLIQIRVNQTNFNLRLFPTGGYNEWPEHEVYKIGIFQSSVVNLSGVLLNYIIAIVTLCIAFNKTILYTFNRINFYFIPYVFSEVKRINADNIWAYLDELLNNLHIIHSEGVFLNFWFVLGVVNFALFFINLLPLPSLDGGQIVESIINKALLSLRIGQHNINKLKKAIYFILNSILCFGLLANKKIIELGNPYILIQMFVLGVVIPILFLMLIKTIKNTDFYKRFIKSE